jgi:hypothetical protein
MRRSSRRSSRRCDIHAETGSPVQLGPHFSMDMPHLGELVGITDLAGAVVDLVAACVTATPSCVALRVTSPAPGVGHAIATVDYDHVRSLARASLRLDLLRHDPGPTRRWPVVTILLFAGLQAHSPHSPVKPITCTRVNSGSSDGRWTMISSRAGDPLQEISSVLSRAPASSIARSGSCLIGVTRRNWPGPCCNARPTTRTRHCLIRPGRWSCRRRSRREHEPARGRRRRCEGSRLRAARTAVSDAGGCSRTRPPDPRGGHGGVVGRVCRLNTTCRMC